MPILSTIGAASYRGFVTQSYGVTATYLVVGGGGGGGGNSGGGGGAGGLITGTTTLTIGTTYTITVGAGGVAGSSSSSPNQWSGNNGGHSIISGTGLTTIDSVGGGGGGGYASLYSDGFAGGSGGGGSAVGGATGVSTAGGSATSGQGYAGGGCSSGGTGAGGGGGAGAVGTTVASNAGGNGGVGVSSSITGTATYYSGGGGGSARGGAAGTGGLGGGGTGGLTGNPGTNGTANTGGGGGGGAAASGQPGGTGGSGIALISSPYVAAVSSLTGSPTIIALQSYTNYSGSFNGSNQYLTAGAASNWTFLSNGSTYTVECWFNVPSTSTLYTLIATAASTVNIGIFIGLNGNTAGDVSVQIDRGVGGTLALQIKDTVGNRFTANTWNHLAVVYNSSTSTCTVYMNGVSILSATGSSFNSSAPTYTLAIGRYQDATPGGYLNGYISNLRITNTVVYTSAFTPSTVPLTAITGTQLLTLQNATITDTSTNAYTITNNGSVTTSSTVQPFAQAPITNYVYKFTSSGSLTYTKNTFLNYSASFISANNTSLSSTTTSVANFNAGQAFTVECWFNYTGTIPSGSYPIIFSPGNSSYNNFVLTLYPGGAVAYGKTTVGDFIISSSSFNAGTWNHVAICRNTSGSTRMWVNGTSQGTYTDSNSYNSAPLYIGCSFNSTTRNYNGYISNLRVVANTDIYGVGNSTITVPTTHLTAVSGTQLLTCQNAALVDNSLNNFAITNNNTVTTTYTTVPFNY